MEGCAIMNVSQEANINPGARYDICSFNKLLVNLLS